MSDLMTGGEVSNETRVPEATLRYWRHLGDRGPRSFKLGRRVMYKRADVEKWMQEAYDAADDTDPAA